MRYAFARKFTVDTNKITYVVPACKQIIILNHGSANVYVGIDADIDTNQTTLLDAGLSLTWNGDITTLYLQAASGTATVDILVNKQAKS